MSVAKREMFRELGYDDEATAHGQELRLTALKLACEGGKHSTACDIVDAAQLFYNFITIGAAPASGNGERG